MRWLCLPNPLRSRKDGLHHCEYVSAVLNEFGLCLPLEEAWDGI
jgi:hypothetical protein